MIPISLLSAIYAVGLGNVLYFALTQAYTIRILAIEEYGRVIHEFDPYFNYRATEYLWQHGWYKFRTWFDYQSWYPLGRPVGTTIYPGMQVTSVLIKKYILPTWSINDICCFVPAWFGVMATVATAMIAYECCVGVYFNKHITTVATTESNSENDMKNGSNNSTSQESSKGSKKKKPASNKTTTETAASTTKKTTTTTQLIEQEELPASHPVQAYSTILNDIPVVKQLYQAIVVPIWRKFILKYWIRFTGSPHGLCVYDTSSVSMSSTNLSSPALEAAVGTALCMSIVPAHLMRSVGGGYDNESIAVFAMTFTFYCWVRSLRGGPDVTNYFWGILSGIAYFNMAAAWGGYVFVLNMVGVHASVLVLLGRYSTKVHRAYTCFYLVGTALATRVPVVGLTPLKSMEQVGPLLTFGIYQLLELCQIILRRKKQKQKKNKNTKKKNNGAKTAATDKVTWKEWLTVHIQVFAVAAIIVAVIAYFLNDRGYFGPISSRVRGLFVKHTKTGNPLVDSVAEHQPANESAYRQYLDLLVDWVPWGLGIVALTQFHDGSSFLVVYGFAAYYFSGKMVRLILLTAPIASILSGITLAHILGWGMTALFGQRPSLAALLSSGIGGGKSSKAAPATLYKENIVLRLLRFGAFAYLAYTYHPKAKDFYDKCHELSKHLSHPTIIQKGRTREGQTVVVDDYREAYWWLRDNTPEDARILAWWDYGYQIAGIANRTTIADGNTWNHEHIALLGRTLTSPLKDGHRIARHLADYVLLWTGGGGDDVAKSPHMRRIANSVYRFLCPNDPTCRNFGMDQYGGPTKAIKESLLYQLHSHKLAPGVEADKNRFRLVKTTKHGKVRIFKILSVSESSKQWVLNNRKCDAPGSWFCPGTYPPALQKILGEKKNFRQLEDFNAEEDHDSEYTKQYFENLNNPEKAKRAAARGEKSQNNKNDPNRQKLRRLSKEEIAMLNNPEAWDDNQATTAVWTAIHVNKIAEFRDMLIENPELAHIRSKDGRGPIWWAHEYGRTKFVKLLTKLGVSSTELKDEYGFTPKSISIIED